MATSQGTQFLKEVLKNVSNKTGYDKWLRQAIKVISGGNGTCVCEMTVGEEHVNSFGSLHGGCTATLVDFISTMALMTSPRELPGVSVNLSVNYLKAANLGEDIIIDAKTLRAGKTLAFLTVDIKNKADGSLIAVGKHVKFIGMDNFQPKNHL